MRNLERLVEELEFHVVRAGALSVYLMHKDGTRGVRPACCCRRPPIASTCCWRRPGLPSSGRGCPAGGDADAPHRQSTAAARLRPAGPVRPARRTGPRRGEREARGQRGLGRFTLRSGATLPLADVYRDEAQGYDICDVRGKICF